LPTEESARRARTCVLCILEPRTEGKGEINKKARKRNGTREAKKRIFIYF
jgi:hypothetical protein